MTAQEQLYDAVARWHTRGDPAVAVDAACQALIDGLDSPALRLLAGASPRDRDLDIRQLVAESLEELHIPLPWLTPGDFPGRLCDLRLAVTPVTEPEAGGGFQVQVYLNGNEMTTAAAGLGMDPFDLLIPDNRLIATEEPHTVPFARCTCGEYGCGQTDITIVRDGERVHWDWLVEKPLDHGVSFAAEAYDAEVARVAADHSWETPERTAARLLLTGVDRETLAAQGLTPVWAVNDWTKPELLRVCLRRTDGAQVFALFPWRGRDPEELAREVCETLKKPPREWPTT